MEETKKFAPPLKVFVQAFFAALFAVCAFFALSAQAQAATTMYVSPASGTYAPGATFTVGVYISTPADKPANAISSTVSFPKDLLEVSSVSTGGSIVTLWVANPSFSNSAGTVHFEGVIVNPGYNGTAGKLVSITFKAKASGAATVAFPSGSILANDGLGTNILTGFGTGKYTITGGEVTPPVTPPVAPPTGVPSAPVIVSSTHPDPSAWSLKNDPVFSWKLPSGVTGVNIIADHNANTDPGTVSDGTFNTYSYTDVDDGVWYMHVKFQNEKGWGATSHYRFQIDTTAPSPFALKLLDGKETDVAESRISFFTDDALSGLAHYVVKVDGVEVGRVSAAEVTASSEFKLPAQTDGQKTVSVDAVDRAGNVMSTKAIFTVTLPVVETPSVPSSQESGVSFGGQFPGLNFIVLLAGLLLLLVLIFAAVVLWRSSTTWGLVLIGRRRRTLLNQLIRIRSFVTRHFKELEQDVVATNFTSSEKKTAARVAKNLHELQESLTKEIDYLSE